MTATTLPQGDLRLLQHPTATALLTSRELARVAYTALDGSPRVLPIYFHWTGTELVLPTFAGSHKVAAIRRSPNLAVTIDRAGPPPEVLLLRGRAELTEVAGVLPEYAAAHERYNGPEQARAAIEQANQPGVRMVRIAFVPTWVGVLDFETRFPGAQPAEAER